MAADHERLDVIDELLAAGTPIDATDEVWAAGDAIATENGRRAEHRPSARARRRRDAG